MSRLGGDIPPSVTKGKLLGIGVEGPIDPIEVAFRGYFVRVWVQRRVMQNSPVIPLRSDHAWATKTDHRISPAVCKHNGARWDAIPCVDIFVSHRMGEPFPAAMSCI